VPFFFGHTLLVGWNVVEHLLEASIPTLGESESHGDRVEDSSQDFLPRRPTGVAFHELARGDGFTPRGLIECVHWTEHVVNCSEQDAANAAETTCISLSHSEKIVNKDVHCSKDACSGLVQEGIQGRWDRQGRNQGSWWRLKDRHGRRRFGCRQGLEVMGFGVASLENTLIADVSDCLCGGAETGQRICPAHGEGDGKRNQKFFACQIWKSDTELENIGGIDPNAIETVSYI
jgi:hypothetical protein